MTRSRVPVSLAVPGALALALILLPLLSQIEKPRPVPNSIADDVLAKSGGKSGEWHRPVPPDDGRRPPRKPGDRMAGRVGKDLVNEIHKETGFEKRL